MPRTRPQWQQHLVDLFQSIHGGRRYRPPQRSGSPLEPALRPVIEAMEGRRLLTAGPDLTLTKNDGVSSVVAGQMLTYTLTISNVGGALATGVTATDTLPVNTTFNSASDGGSFASGVVTWSISFLDTGATVTRTVTVNVDNPVPAGVTSITNVASVNDDGANGADANPSNNIDTDTDTLLAPVPDLSVSKTDGLTLVVPGQTLTYTLSIRNVGNALATGVTATDTLPVNTSFVSVSDGGTFSSGVVTWAIGSLAAGATLTRTVTVTVDNPVPAGVTSITNTASVTDDGANGADLTPSNNIATDTDALPGAVGDFVWQDTNANGQQDAGEPGVDGVLVQLLTSNDNVIRASTTTGDNPHLAGIQHGFYEFTFLTPASYVLEFGAPTGFTRTSADVGNDATDSDASATTGRTGPITLAGGETKNTIDAGLVPIAQNKLTAGDTLTANLFLNLANTDDIGTYFDVVVRAYKGDTAIAEGTLDRLAAKRTDAVAKVITLTVSNTTSFAAGDSFTVKVFTRIDAGPGHSSGRLQLQYDAVSRSSNVVVNFGSGNQTFYLHGGGEMNTTDNTGDSIVDLLTASATKSNGNQEVLLGNWTLLFS